MPFCSFTVAKSARMAMFPHLIAMERKGLAMRKLIVLLSALFLVSATQAQAEPPAKNTATQVESLMKERRDVLQNIAQMLNAQYRVGTAGIDRVVSATNKLADAELELAKTKDERIAVCRKQVESCRDFEKLCQARHEVGIVTQADVLIATAERLKAEIQLLREQAGDKPGEEQVKMKKAHN